MRTLAAFLFAPCAASLLYAPIAATLRPPLEGPRWIDSFGQHFLVSLFVSYALSLTFGSLVFLVLRQMNRESLATYATLGALGGILYSVVMSIGSSANPGLFAIGAIFSLFGASVSTCFALIRGVPRKAIPRGTTV